MAQGDTLCPRSGILSYYLQSSWGNNAQWPGGLQIIGLTTVSTLSFKSWRRDNAVLGFDSNEMRFSPTREEVLRGAFEGKHVTSYDRYIRNMARATYNGRVMSSCLLQYVQYAALPRSSIYVMF